MGNSVSYQLEKWAWSEADFDRMGWHDARIYAVQFGKDISFDVDYIFEWVKSDADDFFSFVVAPVTLVFLNPTSILFNVDCRISQQLEVEDIQRRVASSGSTEWCIETHQGTITITADSFRQVVRRQPTLQTGQQVLPEERGDSSFSVVPDTTFSESTEVRKLKAADFALREKAVQIRRLRRQLEILLEQRSAGVLEVKQYLLEKRRVEDLVSQLKIELQAANYEGVV
ncbi:hypothetical protein HHL22_16420 [Hymenobacter sp. RP-2-7]|uniref:Uncharacterized protein n=1 Tax=Hymenobacter polaris TaxID=2682546 RepID=A0A7Y0FNB9_9BACT|nr:hypothetical protein [Hymenobacter polaris]NML66792.1 hypothetical protein [Hymenobacter polaris]